MTQICVTYLDSKVGEANGFILNAFYVNKCDVTKCVMTHISVTQIRVTQMGMKPPPTHLSVKSRYCNVVNKCDLNIFDPDRCDKDVYHICRSDAH